MRTRDLKVDRGARGRLPSIAVHGWREEEIGRSRRGIPIVAHLPALPADAQLAGLVVAALHGEEPESLQVARRLLERVRGTRSRWAVVACANPDGILAATRQNAAGVDLNRNFPSSSWSPEPSFTYPPGATVRRRPYRTNRSSPGETPGSEPEVQALLGLIERARPALVVDVHAPLALIAPTPAAPADAVATLAAASGLPVHPEIGSPTPGALRDWCAERGQPCITYELEHGPLPAVLGRHVPALAGLIAEDAHAEAPPAWAEAVALVHRGRAVARVLDAAPAGDGTVRATVAAVDGDALDRARRATMLDRLSAAVPHDLPDADADRLHEAARHEAGIAWNDFRELRSGWDVLLADGSVRPLPGPVEVDGEGAAWAWLSKGDRHLVITAATLSPSRPRHRRVVITRCLSPFDNHAQLRSRACSGSWSTSGSTTAGRRSPRIRTSSAVPSAACAIGT